MFHEGHKPSGFTRRRQDISRRRCARQDTRHPGLLPRSTTPESRSGRRSTYRQWMAMTVKRCRLRARQPRLDAEESWRNVLALKPRRTPARRSVPGAPAASQTGRAKAKGANTTQRSTGDEEITGASNRDRDERVLRRTRASHNPTSRNADIHQGSAHPSVLPRRCALRTLIPSGTTR